MFIPASLQFYSPITDNYLSLCRTLNVLGKSDKDSLSRLVKKMRGLLTELGIPVAVKDLGISKGDYKKNMEKLVLYSVEDIDSIQFPADDR